MIKTLHKIYPNKKLKVAAYARISNDKEELQTSLNEQIIHYTNLIMENPEWEFAGIYPDLGISGTTLFKRKEFMKMIENAKLGQIDIILVKSISRFSRNLIDFLTILRELRNLGIEVYFEDHEVSSFDEKCDQMITVMAALAEENVKGMSENVKWRYQVDYRKGRYQFPTNLYGYRVKNRIVTIVENEAMIVREIYELYLKGLGVYAISKILNERGIKSPLGKGWHQNTIHKILENEKYVGDACLQKTYIADVLTHKKVKNRGERDMYIIENDHPAIVDRNTWNLVQKIKEERRKHYSIKSEARSTTPILSPLVGFVVCGNCKHNYIIKTNHYYGVEHKVKKFLTCGKNRNQKNCNSENVDLDIFRKGVIHLIKKLKNNPKKLKEVLLKGFGFDKEASNENDIQILSRDINMIKSKLGSLMNNFDDFSIALKEQLMDELKKKTNDKLKLENEILITGSPEIRTNAFIKKLNQINDKTELSDDLITKLFDKALVQSKNSVILIIGNKDINQLSNNIEGQFKVRIPYMVRCTEYYTDFSIYINR